jgi:hypothetical protein
MMPWGVAARVLNRRMGIFDHPIAWASQASEGK